MLGAVIAGACPCHRRHDDAVLELVGTDLYRRKNVHDASIEADKPIPRGGIRCAAPPAAKPVLIARPAAKRNGALAGPVGTILVSSRPDAWFPPADEEYPR